VFDPKFLVIASDSEAVQKPPARSLSLDYFSIARDDGGTSGGWFQRFAPSAFPDTAENDIVTP